MVLKMQSDSFKHLEIDCHFWQTIAKTHHILADDFQSLKRSRRFSPADSRRFCEYLCGPMLLWCKLARWGLKSFFYLVLQVPSWNPMDNLQCHTVKLAYVKLKQRKKIPSMWCELNHHELHDVTLVSGSHHEPRCMICIIMSMQPNQLL